MRTEGQLRQWTEQVLQPEAKADRERTGGKGQGPRGRRNGFPGSPHPLPGAPWPLRLLPASRAGNRRDPKSLGTRGRCRVGALPGAPAGSWLTVSRVEKQFHLLP